MGSLVFVTDLFPSLLAFCFEDGRVELGNTPPETDQIVSWCLRWMDAKPPKRPVEAFELRALLRQPLDQLDALAGSREALARLHAAQRAANSTGFPNSAIPSWIIQDLATRRLRFLRDSFFSLDSGLKTWYLSERRPVIQALREIELSRIFVDDGRVPADSKFWANISRADGFAAIRFDSNTTKTGRIKVESGFNCLGIPNGLDRFPIVSRYRGAIVSLDFDAIDLRSIVSAIPELHALYSGSTNFHQRSAELIFEDGCERERAKLLTYSYIYGGSLHTVAARCETNVDEVQKWIKRAMCIFRPIEVLKTQLGIQAQSSEAQTHSGQTLGIFAQQASARVFDKAMVAATVAIRHSRSKIIFPVHDELVLDVYPEESEVVEKVRQEMMKAVGPWHYVRMSQGPSYGELR